MTKWAVVACDQFTSQPEYWQAVEETVGDAPSTLRLILPEAKLNGPDVDSDIAAINMAMKQYLDGDFWDLKSFFSFAFIKQTGNFILKIHFSCFFLFEPVRKQFIIYS